MQVGFDTYQDLIGVFLKILEKRFGKSLISVVLYGSVARGKASQTSDVDLLIILGDPPKNYHRRLDPILESQKQLECSSMYKKIKDQLGVFPFFSYLILSKEEAQENRYIYLDMIEDGKILYDRDGFFFRKMQGMKKRIKELGSKKIYLEDGSWYWDLKPDLKPGEVFAL